MGGMFFQIPERENDEFSQYLDIPNANCYQFALRLKIPVTERLLPGFTCGKTQEYYSDEELIKSVFLDLKALGLSFRECTNETHIENPSSWKIAVMNCDLGPRYDFHFLRQSRVNGSHWIHKYPNSQLPDIVDITGRIITDPATAKYPFRYHLVKYLMVWQNPL